MNKAFSTAKFKGFVAGLQGTSAKNCPYTDWRTGYHNGVTFSMAFRKYWFEGRDEGERLKQKIVSHPNWSDAVPHACPLCGYRTGATNVHRKCPQAPLEEVSQPVYCDAHKKTHSKTTTMAFTHTKKRVYLAHSAIPMAVEEKSIVETKVNGNR